MNRNDITIISKIADRFIKALPQTEKMSLVMDIDYAHQDIPLKLQELLEADDNNFYHDVGGIRRNLNRVTKKIENCFVPRYAA